MGETIIKQKREELGLSQSQFSERSGVNFRTLQDYEQGRKPIPSIKCEVLYRISSSLGCSMEEILLESMDAAESEKAMWERVRPYCKEQMDFMDRLLEKRHSGKRNTPFDDVFRTIFADCSKLLIPVINLMFGEDYDDTAIVEQRQGGHFLHGEEGAVEKTVSNMNCVVLEKNGRRRRYLAECQSREDATILVRLFEYATEVAPEGGYMEGDTFHVEYPRSALLYLRHTKNTPDELKLMLHTPGGEIDWKIPVMKLQEYSVDDIFERHLYVLIPFYLLTYEKQLAEIAGDHERVMKLKREYGEIFGRLEKAVQDGFLNANQCLTIRNASKRICSHLAGDYGELYTELNSVLGGEGVVWDI